MKFWRDCKLSASNLESPFSFQNNTDRRSIGEVCLCFLVRPVSARYRVKVPSTPVSGKDQPKARMSIVRWNLTNSQYPVEKIGGAISLLRIDFVTPEQFGFSLEAMRQGNIATIVCGHVSVFGGLVPHTEMARIYKQVLDGKNHASLTQKAHYDSGDGKGYGRALLPEVSQLGSDSAGAVPQR